MNPNQDLFLKCHLGRFGYSFLLLKVSLSSRMACSAGRGWGRRTGKGPVGAAAQQVRSQPSPPVLNTDGLVGPEWEQCGRSRWLTQAHAWPGEVPATGRVAILACMPTTPAPTLTSALPTQPGLGAEERGGVLLVLQGTSDWGNGRNTQSQFIPEGPVGTLSPTASASLALILLRAGNWNQRREERKPLQLTPSVDTYMWFLLRKSRRSLYPQAPVHLVLRAKQKAYSGSLGLGVARIPYNSV